jgi:hypothetical protein
MRELALFMDGFAPSADQFLAPKLTSHIVIHHLQTALCLNPQCLCSRSLQPSSLAVLTSTMASYTCFEELEASVPLTQLRPSVAFARCAAQLPDDVDQLLSFSTFTS